MNYITLLTSHDQQFGAKFKITQFDSGKIEYYKSYNTQK